MKNLLLIIGLVIAIVISCKKANNSEAIQLKGSYKGTFQRQATGERKISTINIDFSSNSWSGESEFAKYPGLCYGAFEIIQDSILFTNLCPWTAEFDQTLVLSQKYKLKIAENVIEISRNYENGSKDLYLLRKE